MTGLRTQFMTQVRAHSGAGIRFSLDPWALRVNSGSYPETTERPACSTWFLPILFLFYLGSEDKTKMHCEPPEQVRVQRVFLQSLHVLPEVGPCSCLREGVAAQDCPHEQGRGGKEESHNRKCSYQCLVWSRLRGFQFWFYHFQAV